jgi:uncharacterized surface protein with fasciclin (FAS1) repeats
MNKQTYQTPTLLASALLAVMALGPLSALTIATDAARDEASGSNSVLTAAPALESANPLASYEVTRAAGLATGKQLSDIASGAGTFDIFESVVRTAGLDDLLSGSEPYTLFVPTNEAFAALPSEQLDALMSNRDAARALVEAHAVRGKLSATDLLVVDSTRSVSGQVLPLDRADEIRVADAAVMVTEVADNGVVHVIDAVL